MTRISVNITAVRAATALLKSVEGRGTGIRGFFAGIRNAIDSRILGRRGIAAKHAAIMTEIKLLQKQLERLRAFVDDSMNQYANADSNLMRGMESNRSGSSVNSFDGEMCFLPILGVEYTAYIGAVEAWLIGNLEEINSAEELEALLLVLGATTMDGIPNRHMGAISRDATETRRRILELLHEKSQGNLNPNQLRAVEELRRRFLNPEIYLAARDNTPTVQRLINDLRLGLFVHISLSALALKLPPVGVPIKAAWNAYSWTNKVIKIGEYMDSKTPRAHLNALRTHLLAELSLKTTLYNNMLMNDQISLSDRNDMIQQMSVTTSTLLSVEIELKRRDINTLEEQLRRELRNNSDGRVDFLTGQEFNLPNPVQDAREQRIRDRREPEINAARQQMEVLQQHLASLNSLNSSNQTITVQIDTLKDAMLAVT